MLTPRWQADVSGGHHLHEIFSSSLQFQAAHDADCNSVADFFKDAAAAASDSAEHPKSALLIAAPAAAPVSATHDASGSISNEIATSPGDFTFAVPVVDQSAYMYQGNGAGMALGSSLDAGDNTGRDKHAEGTAYQQSIKQRACVSKSNRTDCTDGTTHLAVDTDAGHVLRPHNRGLAEADTKVVVNVGLQHNAQANIAVELVQPPSSPEVCSLDVLIKTGHVVRCHKPCISDFTDLDYFTHTHPQSHMPRTCTGCSKLDRIVEPVSLLCVCVAGWDTPFPSTICKPP